MGIKNARKIQGLHESKQLKTIYYYNFDRLSQAERKEWKYCRAYILSIWSIGFTNPCVKFAMCNIGTMQMKAFPFKWVWELL